MDEPRFPALTRLDRATDEAPASGAVAETAEAGDAPVVEPPAQPPVAPEAPPTGAVRGSQIRPW